MDSGGDDVSAGAETEPAPVKQPVTLLGAEMLNWSDLEPGNARGPLGGPAALGLLDAVLDGTGRVLVAGPHATALIDRAAAGSASLDVVLRSYDDAELIAERLGLGYGVEPGPVRVFAGGFDRYDTPAEYDVIVALDGVSRLAGTDTPRLGWSEAVGALRERLPPGGRLLLGAANAFGLPRLLEPPNPVRADDEWGRDAAANGEPPAGLDAIRASLGDFAIEATYAVYPDLTSPAVALSEPDPLTVATHVARHYSGRETLAAPYRTAYDAVVAGHGLWLAPGHWFVLRKGEAQLTMPDQIGAQASRGELVEEMLLTATRADDHARLRRVVRGYVDWLRTTDPATAAQAAPENTLADGTTYTLLDEVQDAETADADVVALRYLARFVSRTLAAGERWPWPAGGTPRSQAARLAAMAGIAVDDQLWQATAVPDEPVQPKGSAEQLATITRLTAELAEVRAQVDWFEGQLDKLRRSRSYRVGRAIVSPLRTTYAKLRSRVG
jgi:hypothetical protein